MMIRTYSELIKLKTFEDRFNYLKLYGVIGNTTFGFDRYLNQIFYKSKEWQLIRRAVIIRDNACDLGILEREIVYLDFKDKKRTGIIVHHMNPITIKDFEKGNDIIIDPEFLISTSLSTHNAIHFGNEQNLIHLPFERKKGDTKLWG